VDNLQYADLFLVESREHIAAVNQSLLELEQGSGRDDVTSSTGPVSAIFRAVHTIKGMSASMGYATVAELSHELETVLDRVRRQQLAVDADLMDVLFRSADILEASVEAAVAGRDGEVTAPDLVAQLHALGAPARRGSASAPRWTAPTPKGAGTLVRVRLAPDTPLRGVRAYLVVQAAEGIGRVTMVEPPLDDLQAEQFDDDFALRLETKSDAAEIERVIRGAGDVEAVHVGDVEPAADRRKSGPGRRQAGEGRRQTKPTPTAAVALQSAPAPSRTNRPTQRSVRVDLNRLDTLMNLIGELTIARGRLTQIAGALTDDALDETVTQASRLITELRDEITASRMVAVWQVFDRFPRVVRDAARSAGKEVEFTIEGKEIELDRSMLEEIGESLVHLLRNAVDHGLETREARVAAGKRPVGRLVLSAARDRSAVEIRVSDDGRGIDRDRVLQRAKADGLVDASKAELTEDELLRLLARPGFTTVEQVTDLSGRGVGVDAVYTRVRSLGGAMDIRSVPGQGTTMILRLPLTLAIVRALLARVADEVYAIPLAHVSETVELTPGMVRTVKGREVLLAREEVLPLLRLRSLVGLPGYAPLTDIDLEQVLVIDIGDRRTAVAIDELVGQDEIVVKQFDSVRGALPFFGGATLLGDGTPALIVDVSAVI
jgi:two-component system chemotaxis sensor kinase CheA